MTVIRRDPPNDVRIVRVVPAYRGTATPQPEPVRPDDDPSQTRIIVKAGGTRGPVGPPGVPGPTGPTGPQGATGSNGDVAYEYVQASPAATWIITHGLGRRVNISLFDDAGNQVFSDIEQHPPYAVATVHYAFPRTGSAVAT